MTSHCKRLPYSASTWLRNIIAIRKLLQQLSRRQREAMYVVHACISLQTREGRGYICLHEKSQAAFVMFIVVIIVYGACFCRCCVGCLPFPRKISFEGPWCDRCTTKADFLRYVVGRVVGVVCYSTLAAASVEEAGGAVSISLAPPSVVVAFPFFSQYESISSSNFLATISVFLDFNQ